MKTTSFRNVERLSAYLDGQLSKADEARLEARVKSNPELAATLDDLRQARSLLHRTPQRRVPRNFTLTPKMAGIRPPVPRTVPALSWASAVATLLFIFTLGTNLVGQLSFGASSPMMAAAPAGMGGGGQAENPQPEYGVDNGPAATQPPVNITLSETLAPEISTLKVPEATTEDTSRLAQPTDSQKSTREPISVWLYIWPGLAMLLIGAAFLIRWINKRIFLRKNSSNL
ncbi:MAG: hypothetical protein ABIF04_03525 [Chloroflexota bacterium]